MPRPPRRVLALVLPVLLTLVSAVTPAPATAAPAPVTTVTMFSEPGDYLGGGVYRDWYAGNGTVTTQAISSGGVSVHVEGGTDEGGNANGDFNFSFSGPLAVGSYDAAHRLYVYGSGRGCDSVTGRFDVLDTTDDLSRLWIVYEYHCDGDAPALFGEVRVNEPADPDLLTTAARVSWPEAFPGTASDTVPVRLVNTGTAPVTVSGVSLDQPSTDFGIVDDGCTTIEVGGTCEVRVSFTPTTSGERTATLTVTDSTEAGSHTVQLSGRGTTGYTTFAMRSMPGDPIGEGSDWSYVPTDGQFSASGAPTGVFMSAAGWYARFRPASGDALEAGRTYQATRLGSNAPGEAGMSVDGMGRACSTIVGTFTVHELSFVDDHLQSMSVSYEQHCDGGPALFGSLTWKATDPAYPLPPRVAVRTDRASYVAGDTAQVTVTLSAGSPGGTVALAADPYGRPPTQVGKADVASGGTVTFPVVVRRRTTFTAGYDGGGDLGRTSGSRLVRAAARTTAALERGYATVRGYRLYHVSGTARVRGTVAPNHAGDCVTFRTQVRKDGVWRTRSTTGCRTLTSTSRAWLSVAGRRSLAGVPMRTRVEWAGDTENDASHSAWALFKFKR